MNNVEKMLTVIHAENAVIYKTLMMMLGCTQKQIDEEAGKIEKIFGDASEETLKIPDELLFEEYRKRIKDKEFAKKLQEIVDGHRDQ